MIKYNLICAQDHEFEGWFRDGATYDAQSEAGEIRCPFCASMHVRKAPMAPSVVSSKRAAAHAAPSDANGLASSEVAELRQALLNLRQQIENSATDVGERFPEEARRMHYGETEEKPIFGQASAEERDALREEGIEVLPIPWIRVEN